MARDVAAFEAAIDDEAVAHLGRQHRGQRIAQAGRTTAAVHRAQVHVRQRAIEEPGQFALDAVAVEQHRVAMRGMQARELVAQRVVVRLPIHGHAAANFRVVGRLPFTVNRVAREVPRGAQLGIVLPRIHRRVLARPVQVDEVAAVPRHDQAGAQVFGEDIEPVKKPVGVFGLQGAFGIAVVLVGRNGGADMRHADEQRRAAAVQGVDLVAHHVTRSTPPHTTRRHGLWPKR